MRARTLLPPARRTSPMPTDRREERAGPLGGTVAADRSGRAVYRRRLRDLVRRSLPFVVPVLFVAAWAVWVGGLAVGILVGTGAVGWLLAYLGGFACRREERSRAIGFGSGSVVGVLGAARYAGIADGTGGVDGFFLVIFGAIALVAALFGWGSADETTR